jgi:hypothetical protein
MVDGVTRTGQTGTGGSTQGGPVDIGVQGPDGRLRQQTVRPDQPLVIGGVNISVDGTGQITVRGTDKDESYSIVDGREVGVPGNTVVSIEGNGDPLHLAIPRDRAVRVEGAGGKDDYWAPLDDDFSRASIHDTQGNNWITNVGSGVRGRVSVADNHVQSLQRDKGGLDLVPSGEAGGSAAGTSIGSFLDAARSWLAEKLR